ncbi:MAG: class I SAM-dependent methyltransferase, partial [Flavobacterium sp.]|nr:class I SAM-dependent methyltransferase [Flavobacterium sp.]
TWFLTENIIYPEKISIEQTSSETTAKYKASLVSGEKLIDCTGGFGIDDYYFSKQFKNVIHCELNADLSQIVKHNCEVLKVSNIECHQGDSTKILEQLNQKFDCIYIDPSRRNDAKGKVFMLADCLPNVVDLQDFYFQFTNTILIKTAPILDLQAGLLELKNVAQIHIVAVDNEV